MNSQQRKLVEKSEIREFEAKLIIEVKSHICLYAKNDPTYSNKNSRQSAWEDISSVLGRRVDECQKKWTSLRDSFRSYYRIDTNVPSGSGSTGSVKWIHFQSLRFLIPYVKVPADDCGNYSQELNPGTEMSSSFEATQPEVYVDVVGESEDNIPSPSQSLPTQTKSRQKKRKRESDEPSLDRVLNAIENSGKRKPMEAFFDSICLQTEHFSPWRQINFQRKILDLLAEELTYGTD